MHPVEQWLIGLFLALFIEEFFGVFRYLFRRR